MGKVKVIQKSRKECKCRKCGQVIPIGSRYFRGILNFNPDIIRCEKCGLSDWEVTTSDYQLSVGAIVYNWVETYGANKSSPDEISSELQSIRDDLQDRLDNMPESLQEAPTGELLQERIDQLDSAINELDNINIDDFKSEVVEEYNNNLEDSKQEVEELDWGNPDQYSEVINIEEELESRISEAIEEALGELEV